MTDHVLIALGTNTQDGDRIYHQPDPDDPDVPKCRNNRSTVTNWARKDPDNLPYHRECKQCSGEADNHSHTGTQVCTEIRGLWADDTEGSA